MEFDPDLWPSGRQEFFVVCQTCKVRHTFDIDPEDYAEFRNGKFVQEAFPYLTADQRELMVSHTCGPCFDKMFPEEADDPISQEITDKAWHSAEARLDSLFYRLGERPEMKDG